MTGNYLARTARLAAVLAVALLIANSLALADSVVFSENFDDGDWTANPAWEAAPADPSISISSTRSVSAPYSFKVAAANNVGAISTASGLAAASQSFTCTFNLYVESIPEEAIPWCLRDASDSIVALIFLLPNGKVELTTWFNGGWTRSDVPYALSYGQWHSFRVTYDGSTESLFIDGHTQPDATINQSYSSAPTKLVIGNFSLAHTGTFYVDDLVITAADPPPPPPTGRVYVQFCSDTSTSGIDTSVLHPPFSPNDSSYTSPTGQAAQVMAESYRNAHLDSLGHTIKLTWYLLCGSLYAYGANSGPLLPFELMQDNHGAEIARWGDEYAYHYHTWIWDGSAWVEASEFTPCIPDFERTIAHLVLDRSFYPSSFRSGWNWMSNIWENYLDDWLPYRFEGAHPNGAWLPYHPSPADWRAAGSLRGWESYYDYTPTFTQAKVDSAFVTALSGTSQVMTLYSHLKESDFPTMIDAVHSMFVAAHAKYPTVDFEYVTGREAMLKWRSGTDTTAPTISVSTSDSNGIRTANISTSEDIYQKQPFVALEKTDGTYYRLECTALGANQWQVSYSLADSAKIAAAATDWFGNATVKSLPAPFLIANPKATATSTTAEVTWDTSQPADTRLDYCVMPSGSAAGYSDSTLLTAHHVTLTGLQPAQVYKLDIAGTNEQGEPAQTKTIYVLTNPGEPVVVDNSDPGFSLTGTWSTGNSAAGHYGPNYRYVTATSTGTLHADWTWQAAKAGAYRISVWWSQGGNRCTSATYSVIIGGDEYPKVVNQQAGGGQWNEHGIYDLAAGQTVTVRLSNASSAGNYVIADAARFEPAYVPLASISLGRMVPDGAQIALPSAVVTAVFDGEFYVQEASRIPGIKVIGGGVVEGSTVQVRGTLSTVNGERVITNPVIK